jgi:hypothetical protein
VIPERGIREQALHGEACKVDWTDRVRADVARALPCVLGLQTYGFESIHGSVSDQSGSTTCQILPLVQLNLYLYSLRV